MTDFSGVYPPYKPEWKCTEEEYKHYISCPIGNVNLESCQECMRIDKLLEESGFE